MKVYIEQVILTNFIIDFCILIIISKLICTKTHYIHIILSALFGSIASLIVPWCSNIIISNTLKILTAIIMLQILHINKKQLVSATLMMMAISYIIGGAILDNFGTASNGGYVIKSSNLLMVFVITIVCTFVCCKLIKLIKSKIITNSHIYDTTLINNSTQLTIKSFIDSGNTLYDNNQPVSLINFDTFLQLTNLTLNQYLTNQFDNLSNPHFITANTIAGKRKILVFTINELHLNKSTTSIYKNVQLGVALNFDNTKEYKAILNSSFCIN